MVSLFAQVWLWSLAAFLLGSLFTWLLFAWPARRKLRRLRAAYAERRAAVEARRDRDLWETHEPAPPLEAERTAVEPVWHDEPSDVPEPPRRPAPAPAREPGTARLPLAEEPEPAHGHDAPRAPEPPPEPEPLRGQDSARGHDSRKEVTVRAGSGSHVADLYVGEPQQTPEPPAPGDETARPKLSSGGWWPSGPAPDAEPAAPLNRPGISGIGEGIAGNRDERPAESTSTWFQKTELPPEPEQEWIAPPERAPEPAPAAEAPADQAEHHAQPEQAEAEQPADPDPAEDDRPAPVGFAGNLRALVESRSQEFADRPEQTEITTRIPVVDESEQTPLPRRTPGAGPRPGMRAPTWAQDPQAQANRRREALATPQEPAGAGMIKGHFATRKYHTPDSPQYDEIVAEVLFRTAADAEEAGFRPWDS